ncbi:hypothetical protein JW766_05405 [Candidatus Dojkabacteria bacterium]|nr:hypothetical protein [Candidatus Dojkabacteria bacterium]
MSPVSDAEVQSHMMATGKEEAHAQHINEFVEACRASQSIIDLRKAWDRSLLGKSFIYTTKEAYTTIMGEIGAQLERLGLDMSSQDERVVLFRELMTNPDPDTQEIPHFAVEGERVDLGLHSRSMGALFRILSGCDPRELNTLTLMRLEDVREATLSLRSIALEWTRDQRYTIDSRHPRKAGRLVDDPTSLYWRYSIYTDDFPGYNQENVSLSIPTCCLSREAVLRIERASSSGSSDAAYMENNPQYVPSSVRMQGLQLGGRNSFMGHFDTESGRVEDFLESIK